MSHSYRIRRKTATRKSIYKAVFLGDYGVGKTTLFRCLRDSSGLKQRTFSSSLSDGVGTDKCTKKFVLEGGHTVVLDVWDTGGSERYRTLTRNYYNFASVILLVYNVSKPSSLTNLLPWIEDARKYIPYIEFVLLGNNYSGDEMIDEKTVDIFAEIQGIKVKCKVDLRSSESVHKAFETVAIYTHRLHTQEGNFEDSYSIRLHTEDQNTQLVAERKHKCAGFCS